MVRRAEWAFELPGGLIDASGRRLARAELQPLTGAEEEWLATHPGVPSAIAVTRILTACLRRLDDVASSENLVQQLLVGDRDFLMVQLRRLTLGERIHVIFRCPACEKEMDTDFVVDDVPIAFRPQTTATYSIERHARTIRFRLPVGADQEAVLGLHPEHDATTLLERCVIDDGGQPLSGEDRAAVVEAMDREAPQVDLELNLKCPECGNEFVTAFDTTAFFLQEMRISGKRLMREVHLLAFYYHWSEAEILTLGRDRRRTYLAMLSDDLRPAATEARYE